MISLAAILLLGSLGEGPDYDSWMAQFETAKKAGDYAKCEQHLKEALRAQVTNYAAGSLVWAQLNQNKTQAALTSAEWMLTKVGPTPYAVGSLIDAGIREGAWDQVGPALNLARDKDLGSGADWTNGYVRDMVSKADSLTRPAVYELDWTIPGSEFSAQRPKVKFCFPLLKTHEQTFSYKLSRVRSSRVVESSRDLCVVEIEGTPGQDVTVTGKASIMPEVVGGRTIRQLAKSPLKTAPAKETGLYYYWEEAFYPADEAIKPLVQEVRRGSAVETVQAIIDWRAKEMPYKYLPSGPGTTLARIMQFKCGVCHDASYISTALARANGIPAVVIGGYVLPEKGSFSKVEGSHGWISVKLPIRSWTNVDALDAGSLNCFGRSNFLRFARQEARVPQDGRISLQGYLVSGRRVR